MLTLKHRALVPRSQHKKGYGLAYVNQTVIEQVPSHHAAKALVKEAEAALVAIAMVRRINQRDAKLLRGCLNRLKATRRKAYRADQYKRGLTAIGGL
jgi:hypothetical protein